MKKVVTLIVVLCFYINILFSQENHIIFPRAFAFAIDDMGWNIGNNEGDIDGVGPYRIGIDREMSIQDYMTVVEVGKAVGVRIQGLFIMSEMDRENILAKYPSTTYKGAEWDNTKNIKQEQVDIMEYVKNNAAYLEFGLHGVGHEYWVDGVKNRAEWYSQQDNHPWPEKSMKEHIQCFKDIMAQYGLSEDKGQSFPESFVPCAYGYYWNPDGDYSTGSIMSEAGVKYVNTRLDYIEELNPPEGDNGGGFDNGVIVVNRLNYGNEWFELSSLPTIALDKQKSDIIESHWGNWLAQDDFLQEATTKKWIEYYKMVQSIKDRYLAKNTEQFHSQWLYNKYTKVSESKQGSVEIDNTKMPDDYYKNDILGNMVLKIKIDDGKHVSKATINKEPIACYFEDADYAYIYLPRLMQKEYVLNYEISDKTMPFVVFNDETYNVYNIEETKNKKTINLRVYGNQNVKIYCENPESIKSSTSKIRVIDSNYNDKEGMFIINIKGTDIQGENGQLILNYQ